MKKQSIYLVLTEGDNRVTIDGDFALFSQLINALARHELEGRELERHGLLPDNQDQKSETSVEDVQHDDQ